MKPANARLNRREFLKGCAGAAAALPYLGAAPRLLRHRDSRPHLIFIVTDALRYDHVGANGYYRDTTPELNGWVAGMGVTFRNATSAAAWTFPATAAMMTGRLPVRLSANWNHTTLPAGVPTLAERLAAAGYTTAGFTCAPFSRANRGLGRGFAVYDDSLALLPLDAQGQAAQLNALAQEWLAAWQDADPLFLFLYYFDVHTWYHPPAQYNVRYDATYTGALTPAAYRNGEPVVSGALVPTPRDIEHLVALYDGEIAYWDAMLGQMLGFLRGRGLLDNAAVVVTSDHGDMFGEHGLWTHGNSVYEEVVRIPLLVRYPGITAAGLTVDAPAQHIDIMPTLLEWAGAAPVAGLDGVSLSAVVGGQTVAPRDVFSEVDGVTDPADWAYWLAPRDTLHSIRRGDYKFIQHVGQEAADELYRLGPASPYEQQNVIAAEPKVAAQLRAAVKAKFAMQHVRLPAVMR